MSHRRGSILAITLLIATVGAIIISGLFLYLGESLKLVTLTEQKAVSFYACDSGIETGILHLQSLPWCNNATMPYSESYSLNNRLVTVSVMVDTFSENTTGLYKIIASTPLTVIEAHVAMTHNITAYTVNTSNCGNVSYSAKIITYTIK